MIKFFFYNQFEFFFNFLNCFLDLIIFNYGFSKGDLTRQKPLEIEVLL